MKITFLTNDRKQALIDYNRKVFPLKRICAEHYLNFWWSKSPSSIEGNLILEDENGAIRGQILTSEMSYFYKGEKKNTVWLFDLIVDEDLRKSAWGVDVILACFQKHPRSFSTGSGPTALPIHLKLGNKYLGDIRKYVGIVNPMGLLTSFFRSTLAIHKYPQRVSVGADVFVRVDKDDLFDLTEPYNDYLWETSRERDFLKWRFFNDLHQYAFYKDEQSNDYFVVRTTVQRGVTVCLLVDYRCEMISDKNFERIFQAVVSIMKTLHLGILITGSSLKTVDGILEKYNLRSVGRPRPVIGFLNVKERKVDIENRNFAFVTLADSDGETNWI